MCNNQHNITEHVVTLDSFYDSFSFFFICPTPVFVFFSTEDWKSRGLMGKIRPSSLHHFSESANCKVMVAYTPLIYSIHTHTVCVCIYIGIYTVYTYIYIQYLYTVYICSNLCANDLKLNDRHNTDSATNTQASYCSFSQLSHHTCQSFLSQLQYLQYRQLDLNGRYPVWGHYV